MAANDGQINGTELGVYIGGVLVGYSTSASLNINMSPRSTSNKEDGGWETAMEGYRSWDVSCDALYAWLTPAGGDITNKTLSDLFTDYITTRVAFELTFGSTATAPGEGYTMYVGQAWLTSASLSAPDQDTSTFSVSFQGSGPLVQTIDTTP